MFSHVNQQPGSRGEGLATLAAEVAGVLVEVALQLHALDVRLAANGALVRFLRHVRKRVPPHHLDRERAVAAHITRKLLLAVYFKMFGHGGSGAGPLATVVTLILIRSFCMFFVPMVNQFRKVLGRELTILAIKSIF